MAGRISGPPLEPSTVLRRVGAALLCLSLGACATTGGLPPRPTVPLPAPPSTVDVRLLVGSWHCQDLNPYPDQPRQTVVATYAADGGFVTESRTEAHGPIGAIVATARGSWEIRDGQLLTSDVRTEARAADGDQQTDILAKASAELVDALSGTNPNVSEILALEPSRMVARPLGSDDPPVIACTR
jgi:hypothetical protein